MTHTSEQTGDHYRPLGPVSVSLALLTVVLWGGTAVSNQFAMDALPPVFVGGVRFGLATIFMLGWCWFAGDPLLLSGRQWRLAGILGLLLFLQIATFNIGVSRSSTSHASILVNSFIFWVAAIEFLIQRTLRLQWWQLVGLALAGSGCGLLVMSTENPESATSVRDVPTLAGDLILALSGMILGIKIVCTKYSVRDVSPGPMILWHDVIGTMLFFAWSAATETTTLTGVNATVIWALLYGGLVISGFCFGVNAWLLKRHGASQVSVFAFATPICGVTLGVLLRGDQLSVWLVVAGILVALGIYLVNRAPRSPQSGAV